MTIVDLNIANEEVQLITGASFPTKQIQIVECIVCNTSASTITLSFFKIKEGDPDRFYVLSGISLGVNETFVLEGFFIDLYFSFYIGVASGSCSLNMTYN